MKILVIQTAFIGDAILATALCESLHAKFPDAQLDLLVRKGNESLFNDHPYLSNIFVLDKKQKFKSMSGLLSQIRSEKYDHLINLHRFASTGFLSWLSGAKLKYGFDKNPLSWCYDVKMPHEIGNGTHEVERNHSLIQDLVQSEFAKPKLFPPPLEMSTSKQYVCMAPASVWFTKQWAKEKWIELIKQLPKEYEVYLIGSPADQNLCSDIINNAGRGVDLCGKLNLLGSAALMKGARMNFVNDSAPMHLASSVNAPVAAIYCSTVPEFGFGPLSEQSFVIQTDEQLDCRPCGLHGHRECPQGHFNCSNIDVNKILKETGII